MPRAFRNGRPLIFGEVLFDAFPDGSEVLGGAPFNVAWHLQGFGLQPLLISRVGKDQRGERIRETMQQWGMDSAGLQVDDEHPSGIVNVTLNEGQPSFEIVADRAYDYIDAQAAMTVAGKEPAALIYHGTLALRNPASRGALLELRSRSPAPVCIDINLRPPWYEASQLMDLLYAVNWAKLNDAELATLSGKRLEDERDLERAAEALRQEYNIMTLVLTRGASGAFLVTGDGIVHGAPAPVESLVDTVGAGDAFSSVVLLGMLRDWPLPVTLRRALQFASRICGVRGATIAERPLYDGLLEQWDNGANVET